MPNYQPGIHIEPKLNHINDLRPHDLRHTFASHYIMRGGSLNVLQKIQKHKDVKMTVRYAHLSKEFARGGGQLLNDLTSGRTEEETHINSNRHCHKCVTNPNFITSAI